MFDLSRFRQNTTLESQGVVLQLSDTASIRVARAGGANTRYAEAFREHLAPVRTQVELGTIDPEVARKLMARAFADGCVIGWDGLVLDGKAVPYSKEAAQQLMIDLPELCEKLKEHAQKAETFRL